MASGGDIPQQTWDKYVKLKDLYAMTLERRDTLLSDISRAKLKLRRLKQERNYLLDVLVEQYPEYNEDSSDSYSSSASFRSASPRPEKAYEVPPSKHALRSHSTSLEDEVDGLEVGSRGAVSPTMLNRPIRRLDSSMTVSAPNISSLSTDDIQFSHASLSQSPSPTRAHSYHHSYQSIPSTSSVSQSDTLPPAKRRRRTGKRDDRSDPKPVEKLPTDENGNIILPVTVGRGNNEVTIVSLGRIVHDREYFHTHRYIWPVGFVSRKVYASLKDVTQKTVYTSEILDVAEAPVFQVTAEDMPERVFRAPSSSGVWKQILDELQAKGVTAKTHASGPEMLGMTNLGVTKAIQELPNAEKCSRYVMQKWIERSPPQRPVMNRPIAPATDQRNSAKSHTEPSLAIQPSQAPTSPSMSQTERPHPPLQQGQP